jgi:hypothetical protein
MKVKIIVIDWEVPQRFRRLGLRIGLPVVLLVSGGAIGHAAVPNVFSSGQTLSAAILNQNFDDVDKRVARLETTVPNATHAVTADTASAIAPGPIAGSLTVYAIGGVGGACQPLSAGSSTVDCTCPAGTFVVSGGGDAGYMSGHFIRESRAVDTSTWRVSCASGTSDALCASYTLVCSRIGP